MGLPVFGNVTEAKKATDADEARRKREEGMIQIRKDKREEAMLKKRR